MCPTIWFLSLYLIRAVQSDTINCDLNFNHVKDGEIVIVNEICKGVPCLTKCCGEMQILFNDGKRLQCENTTYLERKYNATKLEDYSGLAIYNEEGLIKTQKKADDFILLHYDNFVFCDKMNQEIPGDFHSFVLEDGRLALRSPNQDIFINEMDQFCYENSLDIDSTLPKIVIYKLEIYSEDTRDDELPLMDYDFIGVKGMIVSCVFLALVLIVYSLVKELRNLAGIILMAYVATTMAFFLLRVIHVYAVYSAKENLLDPTGCTVMTLLVYYTVLSTFCWMNIISFDIWWTLRAMRKRLPTNRRGVLVKFAWYALYGWGAPLLPAAFVVVADHVDLPAMIPKPNVFLSKTNCFFTVSHSFYVSWPVTIAICINIILFLMTAFNIWRVRKAVYRGTIRNNKNNEARFLVYLKLSLVMGISKICEVLGDNHWVWNLSDFYNSIIGLFVFIIFICKKKVILQLCDRFSIDNWCVQKLRGPQVLTSEPSDKPLNADETSQV